MDIVQYLHGLVSSSMGISNQDTSADLLKQYYALSAARLIELDDNFDSTHVKNHNLVALWGIQAEPLAKRLARSFHMDEQTTMTLLRAITPPMMVEVANLAGGDGLIAFLAQNFESSRTHLPAWSSQFIQSSLTQKIEQLNTQIPTADGASGNFDSPAHPANDNDSNTPPSDDQQDHHLNHDDINQNNVHHSIYNNTNNDTTANINNNLINHKPIKPKIARSNPLLIILGVTLITLAAGGVAWHLLKNKSKTVVIDDPNIATHIATPTVKSLNSPRLSLTSGENGTLYACQAEIGNAQLKEQLLNVLQNNFGQIGCIMDIDDNFGTSMTGLERLESIMAMIKSEPFTSIEIVGNHIYVNTPNTDILPRIINDIALLAPQFEVSPAPALDRKSAISQSFERATAALNNLDDPPDSYDLSRSANLGIIDFNGRDELPTNSHEMLSLLAEKIKTNPHIKLIIVTHTSGKDGTDRMANLNLSQRQAEAVKDFLVEQGVNDAQLTPKGVGNSFPVSDNVTELGRFKNERTEFLVYDETTLSALNVDIAQLLPESNAIMMPPTTYMPDQNMPIQGMPDGNYLPQPVQNAQPVIIGNHPTQYQAPTPSDHIGTNMPLTPSPDTIPNLPDDFFRLSDSTIGSEQGPGIQRELR
ncbi:OmpA family protein [Moraxella nonliquefaciens]|uniref:OmpA family protein n=1 Tax=Moraxella nonliquefaciens TaxID=478 RepID=UPI0024A69239|nr:OmpA family protein [Moraxella nonliquefaciens]MDI4497368.1 OmpA family protein [Moraxella nonliquefaciens]MDI4499303.1 OmpA family protein [Moraxella nonliquefaciens]